MVRSRPWSQRIGHGSYSSSAEGLRRKKAVRVAFPREKPQLTTPRYQDNCASPRWPAVALALLLCFSVLVLAPLGVRNVHQRSDWALADWLINYAGGFVRRGLTGSFALLAAKPLHLPPATVIVCLQWSLYAVMFVAVWKLLRDVRWTVPLTALVFSPATLQFPLMDPNFAFRKDILFLALLGTLLWQLRVRAPALRIVALLACGCASCVLSHEALVVFFPYLFAALWLWCPGTRRAFTWVAFPALLAGVLFIAVSNHPGNPATARAVCSSLGGTITDPPSGLCGGAIAYLSRSSTEARGDVHRVAVAERYSHIMPMLILLSLLPVVLQLRAMWVTGGHRQVRIIASTALVSIAASTGLFFYGTDWTRWIYLHTFSLMLLLVSIAPRRAEAAVPRDPKAPQAPAALLTGSRPKRFALAAFLLLYIFAWHLSLYQPKIPLGGLVHYLHKRPSG